VTGFCFFLEYRTLTEFSKTARYGRWLKSQMADSEIPRNVESGFSGFWY